MITWGILFLPHYFMNGGISHFNYYEKQADKIGNINFKNNIKYKLKNMVKNIINDYYKKHKEVILNTLFLTLGFSLSYSLDRLIYSNMLYIIILAFSGYVAINFFKKRKFFKMLLTLAFFLAIFITELVHGIISAMQ